MKKTTSKKRIARKAATKKRRSNKAPSAKQLAARRKFALAAKARAKAAKAKKRTRNKTIIKAKRIDHLDVSRIHNGQTTRRKIRNSYVNLVIRGTAEKTPGGWKVGRKTIPSGKGIASISSGYYLDKATGTIFAKRTRNAAKKRNPKGASKVRQLREKFTGTQSRKTATMNASNGTPRNLAKLGKLILIKTQRGDIKPGSGTTWLCADAKGKLHFATTAERLVDGTAQNFGEVSQIEYEAIKPHLGHKRPTIFFHKMGEEGGKRPVLITDGKGGLKLRGGSYRIEREGIVD
jgi:hypothetical protein